jgi:hypothetical protein
MVSPMAKRFARLVLQLPAAAAAALTLPTA